MGAIVTQQATGEQHLVREVLIHRIRRRKREELAFSWWYKRRIGIAHQHPPASPAALSARQTFTTLANIQTCGMTLVPFPGRRQEPTATSEETRSRGPGFTISISPPTSYSNQTTRWVCNCVRRFLMSWIRPIFTRPGLTSSRVAPAISPG